MAGAYLNQCQIWHADNHLMKDFLVHTILGF